MHEPGWAEQTLGWVKLFLNGSTGHTYVTCSLQHNTIGIQLLQKAQLVLNAAASTVQLSAV